MNKRGIIIILYSVALLAVLAVILLATVEPKSFTVEVGQTHADIVRVTEIIQNYNSYTHDAAEIAYIHTASHLSNQEEFEIQFIVVFEEIMSEYPNFDDSDSQLRFADKIFMSYIFEFDESNVRIVGIPELYLEYDYYIDENDEIVFNEKEIPDYYYVYSRNFETKIYPHFEITKPSSAPEEDTEESEE